MVEPDEMADLRLFTVEEANALLHTIKPLLVALQERKGRLEATQQELAKLSPAMRGNGHGAKALELEREIAELVTAISVDLFEVTQEGIEVKDLAQGLIDFPSLRDGRVVYLCWRLGEGEIAWWHELDSGFAGREPL